MPVRPLLAKYLATFITGLLECMIFAGVIFGWASLVFVLKAERYFVDLCTSTGNSSTSPIETGCSAQDEMFTLIFTIASFLNNFMTLPTGVIFDKYGTLVVRLIGIGLYVLANLLIAFSRAAPAFMLFPAASMLAIGGILFMLTNMQVGNLFGQYKSTIITLYNGAYDSSSAVFLIVKVLYESGWHVMGMFLFFSFCSVFLLLRTLFLMPLDHIPYPLPENYNYGLFSQKSTPKERNANNEDGVDLTRIKEASKEYVDQMTLMDKAVPPEVTFRSCVCSSLFAWNLVWLSVMQLRHYLFIGTLNFMLSHLAKGDLKQISLYTNAFALTQLFGVFCAPWNGVIMDRHKRGKKKDEGTPGPNRLADLRSSVLSLTLTVVQCVLFSICAAIPVLPVQFASFILQVVNRSFMYGGNAAFIALAFPPIHFGKIYGLTLALAGVVSLLQYPCFALVKNVLDGDPLYVNIGLLLFILPAFAHPINVFLECRRIEKANMQAEATTSDRVLDEGDSKM